MKKQKQINNLLDYFENKKMKAPQTTAYNYLISYNEGLINDTSEGGALIGLCIEVLVEAQKVLDKT